MPSVEIKNLTCRFGGVTAVDGISLTVETGEFVTLLGPSGCGKTTLLRMVAGLENGTGGQISIGDTLVCDADKSYFLPPDRRDIGMVFQSYAIWPHMTVFENVAYPLRVRRKSQQEVEQKVLDALRQVEMLPYKDRPAPALSGGQQQRVAIARALVFQPKVLLLDEPLSNLDAKLRLQMGDEFRDLQRKLGITSLYVTHDQEEAMALSDRIVVMRDGRSLQVSSPEQIYNRPQGKLIASFFGSPNLLSATVTGSHAPSIAGGTNSVSVEGNGFSGVVAASEPFKPGTVVNILIRPETLRISAERDLESDDLFVWRGQVQKAIFRGARRSVVVQTDTTALNLDVPSSIAVAVGDNVTVSARHLDAWAIGP